ncbi:hypothetical protein ACFLU6_16085 [Acidobacteriota bacterium]
MQSALLRDDAFCHQCHSLLQPITKADLQGTVSEWQESTARKEGLSCQKCHMPLVGEGDEKHHFHGHYYPGRNPLPGRRSLSIEEIAKNPGFISVTVKNHVPAHYLPTGASFKAVFLEVKGFGETGQDPQFEDTFVFIKRFKFKNPIGLKDVPWTVAMDTRLKPEEERTITFETEKAEFLHRVVATIRCAFVGDFGFDPEWWTSDYIFEKEVVF